MAVTRIDKIERHTKAQKAVEKAKITEDEKVAYYPGHYFKGVLPSINEKGIVMLSPNATKERIYKAFSKIEQLNQYEKR